MKIISDKNNLQVLHEDNHIIVINKRVGDIVQGDKTGDKPLSEVVKEYIKDYNEDLETHEANEVIVLLESKKVLIEEKIAELESMASILLENEKRNARIVSLTNKIKELLEESHNVNDYKVFKFHYLSKYYLGYKHMIKIIQNEKVNELLDKIPLLEAKQKEEEEKERKEFLKIRIV